MKPSHTLLAVVMVSAGTWSWYASRASLPSRTAPLPILDVTAAKGRSGLSITNRESELLTGCTVTLLERGRDDAWTAVIGLLEPMDTARIGWDEFHEHGAAMPAYIGLAVKRLTVQCQSHARTRRGAGLEF